MWPGALLCLRATSGDLELLGEWRFYTLSGFPGVRRPSAHDVFHFPDWALLLVCQHMGGGHGDIRGVLRRHSVCTII